MQRRCLIRFFLMIVILVFLSGNAFALKYYIADYVPDKDGLATLSSYGINTVITPFHVDQSSQEWIDYLDEADRNNIDVIVFPADWSEPRDPRCGGIPYPSYANIDGIKTMLDAIGSHKRFKGIFNAHEPYWSCVMSEDEMATLRSRLKDYVMQRHGREIKIWNYVDDIALNHVTPGMIGQIMDVAVVWNYCIDGSEATCRESKQRFLDDREMIDANGLNGQVELVYLFQTFYIAGTEYTRMPTSQEMNDYACDFIGTGALDGFAWYTWSAHWYSGNLDDYPALWPTIKAVKDSCISGSNQQCVHQADNNPCDGQISASEIMAYLSSWRNGASISLSQLMEAIRIWKG